VVLIADASQNAMAGEYRSIGDGVVLVGTIAGWNWVIDWAGYRSRLLRKFLQAPATLLVRDGQVLQASLRRELITRDELMGALHRESLTQLNEVARAWMESDGSITVVPRD